MRTRNSMIVLVSILAMLNGCSLVKPFHPVTIDQGRIGVSSKYLDKNVVFVEFLTKNETAHPKRVPMVSTNSTLKGEMEDPGPFSIIWAIKAISPVPAKDLQIVPGTVPQGFYQVVPSPPGGFKPVTCQEYHIVTKLEPVDDPFYSMSTKWIP